MPTDRCLIWTTTPPAKRQLRKEGYFVVRFASLRRDYIGPAREITARRAGLGNAAEGLLRLFDRNEKVAVLGVPAATAGDIADIYSYLVEPAFRRDVTLLLGVDRSLDAIDCRSLVEPSLGYPWSCERLKYIAERYQCVDRDDGLPPLTPIEDQLLGAMRETDLTPEVQYGIGPFRVDFAFPSVRLAVEADGRAWHDAERDAARDQRLRSKGWEVIHVTGSEISRDARGAAARIGRELQARSVVLTYTELEEEPPRRSWWQRFLDWLPWRDRPSADPLNEPLVPVKRPVPQWKQYLDKDQRRAVDANEGVVQIIAPAGSGKTTTMLTRVQELLTRGVPATRILCTTFNVTTREELEVRLKQLGIVGPDVKSFHALGWMILDEEGHRRSDTGTISYAQWRRLAKQAMDGIGGVWLDAPVASELISDYKLAKMWTPAEARAAATNNLEGTAAEIYTLYEQHLEEADLNDYDDLIIRSLRLLRGASDIRRRWQDRWECVLVDEFQDIEPAQELLIQMVAAPEDSLFAVGDEDQCIYSWRRASVERIVMLDTVYPGLERVVLGTSYRCPTAITQAAERLIVNNQRRFPKAIRPNPHAETDGEIEVVDATNLVKAAGRVAAMLEGAQDPQEVVVLARTSRLLREVAKACLDRGIAVHAPARALGATDAERTVLAYLRLASSPRTSEQEDVRQSFRVPNRYLMQEAEEDIARALRAGKDFRSTTDELQIPPEEGWRKKAITEWGALLVGLSQLSPHAALRRLRIDGGLDKHYSSVERMSPHDQVEIESLDDIEALAEGKTMAEFVTALEARAANLAAAIDEDGIELATIHGAKGREWDTVILFGAIENQLPHFRTLAESESQEAFEEAVEDERRLAYVAVTRTRQRLVVVTGGAPSPFLREAGILAAAAPIPTKGSVDAAARAESNGPQTAAKAKKANPAKSRKKVVAKPDRSRNTTAKYEGYCRACGSAVRPGQTIVRYGEHWIHERCAAQK